jgi:nucleoside-diphosphate-sugar epimerase
MKKIIVTGHNGFIGTLLVNLLIEKGYEVIGIDTNYYGKDCGFYPFQPKIKEINKDTREIIISDLEGAYAICHLAALSNDPMGELNQELTFDINHLASVKIAEMAKKAGVEKFIYSSSCSLYGMAGGESALTEEAEFGPITAYAKSKVYSERDILPMSNQDFCVTFLRNATAYGVSQKLRLDLVVNNLVGWAVTTNQIRMMSDGSPWRPIVHAEDIARAFIAVIETPKEVVNRQSYNVGLNSENYQVKDIANMVQKVIPSCEVVFTGEHGSDSRTYRVNFDKIANQLPNFKPKWNLKTGIEQVYESYQRLGMNDEKFNGRYFIRLKQLQYLIQSKLINENLFWV